MNDELDMDPADLEDTIRACSARTIFEARMGVTLDEFTRIDPNKIHQMAGLPEAWTDGCYVLFHKKSEARRKKWLYYIGAENDATLEWFDGEFALYSNIGEGRIEDRMDEDELTLEEHLALEDADK